MDRVALPTRQPEVPHVLQMGTHANQVSDPVRPQSEAWGRSPSTHGRNLSPVPLRGLEKGEIMNDELCNEPNCGVCVRQDVSAWDDEYARLVTYVGDYVVLTAVAPQLYSSAGRLSILSSGVIPAVLPIAWEVCAGDVR